MTELGQMQERIGKWVASTFGAECLTNKTERALRLVEEALELAQSMGLVQDRASALVGYVYGRPIGVPRQELGGVLVTALAAAECLDFDAAGALELEVERVHRPEVMAKCRRKQAAKKAQGMTAAPTPPPALTTLVNEEAADTERDIREFVARDSHPASYFPNGKLFTLADLKAATKELDKHVLPGPRYPMPPRPASPSGTPYDASRKHFLEVRYPGNGRDDTEMPITFVNNESVRELGNYLLTMADNAETLGGVATELRLQVAIPEWHVLHENQRLRDGLNELACSWVSAALECIPPPAETPLTDEGHRALLYGRRLGLARAAHELVRKADLPEEHLEELRML